ncbi:AraC family transcriptional regulator [Oceanicoccus sp. KOV_DT_Chl]|uniref:AraC family transcriptional regulator n=1 Tax=Oceanicoccus sp. KOV_DT_Chl TaxID=1904639 RepID=UPI000C7D847A|nr:AraC family transcriptional regulator [Oceanicoccus sp. KOV_DT_Chl]
MPNIPIHYIHACLSGVEQHSAAFDALLTRAEIPKSTYMANYGGVRPEQFVALVQAVSQHLNDEFFGLTQQPCKPGLFATMARLTNHSSSLGCMYQEWINFYNVVRDDISMHMESHDGRTVISVQLTHPEKDKMHFLMDCTLVALHRFASWLTGKHIQLQQLRLNFKKPSHHALYAQLFNCDISFDADKTALVFNEEYLALPLIRGNLELKTALKTAPSLLMDLPDKNTFSTDTIRAILNYYQRHQRFPYTQQTAHILATSQKTLRRKLNREGTSFQDLKDQLRKDIAIDKLMNEHISLESIADELGFSDKNTFARAFKRWTDLSPGRYREQSLMMNLHSRHANNLSIFY